MRIVITFMLGLTAGVGFIRLAESLGRSAQASLIYYGVGVLVGMIAMVMSLAPWAETQDNRPEMDHSCITDGGKHNEKR